MYSTHIRAVVVASCQGDMIGRNTENSEAEEELGDAKGEERPRDWDYRVAGLWGRHIDSNNERWGVKRQRLI